MWFMFIRQGSWSDPKNIAFAVLNALIFAVGLIVLVGGTYSSVVDIVSFPEKSLRLISLLQILTMYRTDQLLC